MLFASTGTFVVEILSRSLPSCYAHAAGALGQKYYGFIPHKSPDNGIIDLSKEEIDKLLCAVYSLLKYGDVSCSRPGAADERS